MEKDLKILRAEIDQVDEKLVELFARRMDICADVARYKLKHGKSVFDADREREKLSKIEAMSPENMRAYTSELYRCIFQLSKEHQHDVVAREGRFGLLGEHLGHSFSPPHPFHALRL